jgi:hypothetical protein
MAASSGIGSHDGLLVGYAPAAGTSTSAGDSTTAGGADRQEIAANAKKVSRQQR